MVSACCQASRATWGLPMAWWGVAYAAEGGGFVVPVAKVAKQGEGVLVAGKSLGLVAEVVVGVAETH